MTRVYNFGAGPAMLPEPILAQARDELLDWQGTGMSVMEMSHRSTEFMQLIADAEANLRTLLAIPNNYQVFFITAPARSQFAMIPMNLLQKNDTADYFVTGLWSKMAADEAKKFAHINIASDDTEKRYQSIPDKNQWQLNPNARYVYYTANETVNGIEFSQPPEVGNIPLVTDMTSSLLSRPIDINQYGLIFAGTQKNIAPAGLTIVIVRDDLLTTDHTDLPTTYNYNTFKSSQSLYYTPATFTIYMAGLMFKYLLNNGGLPAMAEINQAKADALYSAIDNNDFYHNPIDKPYRSIMNVPFSLRNDDLNASFLKQAKEAGLIALKGHRLVGGMRASIYNAMPLSGVEALVEFMQDFAKRNG